jgi:predicted nucleic acid-binding Zn ribbon protein
MSPTYLCPRCNGAEIYFAKRQRITGLGGIYGNRAVMVNTPLCKQCGETANVILDARERKKRGVAIAFAVIGIVFAVFIVIAFAIDVYNEF